MKQKWKGELLEQCVYICKRGWDWRQNERNWAWLGAGRVQLTHREQRLLQFSSVQSLSHVRLFATPWIAAHQASLSITNSRSLLTLMSIESVMPSNHLILCRPLLPPSIFPSIRVFSHESVLLLSWKTDNFFTVFWLLFQEFLFPFFLWQHQVFIGCTVLSCPRIYSSLMFSTILYALCIF